MQVKENVHLKVMTTKIVIIIKINKKDVIMAAWGGCLLIIKVNSIYHWKYGSYFSVCQESSYGRDEC